MSGAGGATRCRARRRSTPSCAIPTSQKGSDDKGSRTVDAEIARTTPSIMKYMASKGPGLRVKDSQPMAPMPNDSQYRLVL